MKYQLALYNPEVAAATAKTSWQVIWVPKKGFSLPKGEAIGERLARLRQHVGYSQRELAAEMGVSQRLIAYYEKQTKHPPTHLLPLYCQTLGVSADELLGIKRSNNNLKPKRSRLWQRLKRIEKLNSQDRRHIVKVIDALIGASQKIS